MRNAVHFQKFTVSFEYPVYFTTDVLNPSNTTLAQSIAHIEPNQKHRIFVVVDSGVAKAWPELATRFTLYSETHSRTIDLIAPPEIVVGGEDSKNDSTVLLHLQARLHKLGMNRHSIIVVVGGGAVLDMAGYASSTTHRGIRIIRLPTTVLSQADGGVGVKNGINVFRNKNFLGTFAPPFAVINDTRFLETLEARDQIAGMAEAVKVALIRDADFFHWLTRHAEELSVLRRLTIASMIRWCAEIHLAHIASCGDPFENRSARPLDFGHWAAHKLETLSNHRLRHGEAVAIGLALDARYSVEIAELDEKSLTLICNLLERLGLPLWDPVLDLKDPKGEPQVLQGLSEFCQHIGGPLTLTMLKEIGTPIEIHQVNINSMVKAINWLRSRRSLR